MPRPRRNRGRGWSNSKRTPRSRPRRILVSLVYIANKERRRRLNTKCKSSRNCRAQLGLRDRNDFGSTEAPTYVATSSIVGSPVCNLALKHPQRDSTIFASWHEQSMRLPIQCHGLGSLHRWNNIQRRVVIGGILMEREDVAISGGIKNCLCGGIEHGGVHLVADGIRGDHFAVVGVDHAHHFTSAAEKEAAILRVQRQAGGSFARSDLPAIFHRESIRINAQQFTRVFEVDEDVALPVRNCKLRAAP